MSRLVDVVRNNLLNEKGYTPYCGGFGCKTMPRTFFNGEQFQCPHCGWKSSFEEEFIAAYKAVWHSAPSEQIPLSSMPELQKAIKEGLADGSLSISGASTDTLHYDGPKPPFEPYVLSSAEKGVMHKALMRPDKVVAPPRDYERGLREAAAICDALALQYRDEADSATHYTTRNNMECRMHATTMAKMRILAKLGGGNG